MGAGRGLELLALNMAVAGEFSDAALRLVAAGCAALLAVGLARRCAWSDGTALHVREFRTRTVPSAEVTEIYQHKGLLNDSVRLHRRDGSVVKVLPGLGLAEVRRWRAGASR